MVKETLQRLISEWNWPSLASRKRIDNLIWTDYGGYRKDNRVVQNVGPRKALIKFKFEVGQYLGGAPCKTPTHFRIATTGKCDRIAWMAYPRSYDTGEYRLAIAYRRGKVWEEPVYVHDFFMDSSDIQDGEIELLEFLIPGFSDKIIELVPGLEGVDEALQERFS